MPNGISIWRQILGFAAATLALAIVLAAGVIWRSGHLEEDQVGLVTAFDAATRPPEGAAQGRPEPSPGQLAGSAAGPPDSGQLGSAPTRGSQPPELSGGADHSSRVLTANELTDHLGSELDKTRLFSLGGIAVFYFVGLGVFAFQMFKRRDAERWALASQRFEHMGIMAAGTAHDFNNLLMVITGNAALVRLSVDEDSPLQVYVREVDAAVEKASQLTQQLQAYAGAGAGPLQSFDLNSLVADSAHMVQVMVPETTNFKVELSDSLGSLRADRAQIQQVLLNLVKNALDELGDTPGTIEVRTEEMTLPGRFPDAYMVDPNVEPGRYAALTVRDSGSGIPKSEIEHIFNAYASSKGLGRGLGLASVAGIVRSHRGSVVVRSDPERGTEFTVLLPFPEAARSDDGSVATHGAMDAA